MNASCKLPDAFHKEFLDVHLDLLFSGDHFLESYFFEIKLMNFLVGPEGLTMAKVD